jgi:hypothetical protein
VGRIQPRHSTSDVEGIFLTTKLEHPLKRELEIDGRPYMVTISPEALHVVPKGRRKGLELRWVDLVSGDAALATALNASLRASALEPGRRAKPAAKPLKPTGAKRLRASSSKAR